MNRQAEALLREGKSDRAAAVITSAQSWAGRLLAAPDPTLGAMEAVAALRWADQHRRFRASSPL